MAEKPLRTLLHWAEDQILSSAGVESDAELTD